MIRIILSVAFLGTLVAGPTIAFGQDAPAENAAPAPSSGTPTTTTTTKNPRKATLNFEDELVEGSKQKPDLFYVFQKKNFNYKRLIKLRENFLPEMRQTSEDIQRTRGSN